MLDGFISFFIGILLGEFFKNFDNISIKNRRLLKVIISIELIMFIFILTRSGRDLYINDNVYCYNFLFFPEIMILCYDVKWLNNICSKKTIEFLGNISFGIYLWNFPILITFHILYINNIIKIPVTTWTFIFINLVVHIIVSTISYLLIDKKMIPWLKKRSILSKEEHINSDRKIEHEKVCY